MLSAAARRPCANRVCERADVAQRKLRHLNAQLRVGSGGSHASFEERSIDVSRWRCPEGACGLLPAARQSVQLLDRTLERLPLHLRP